MFVCCHALPSFAIEYWAGAGFEDDIVGLQDLDFFFATSAPHLFEFLQAPVLKKTVSAKRGPVATALRELASHNGIRKRFFMDPFSRPSFANTGWHRF